jgi:hypothetical protein
MILSFFFSLYEEGFVFGYAVIAGYGRQRVSVARPMAQIKPNNSRPTAVTIFL